jgi:hypothetical protein
MLSREEIVILVLFSALVLIVLYPQLSKMCYGADNGSMDVPSESSEEVNGMESSDEVMPNDTDMEAFTTQQQLSTDNGSGKGTPGHVSAYDPSFTGQKIVRPMGKKSDYESLIYDSATGAIMSGSQFESNTGIITPLWSPPAWDPDAYGPSSSGSLDPADYENDPRMLYNKCSLDCCSPQYPTPFDDEADPFVCNKSGESQYLSSDYTCRNNTGGYGCLCMTEQQVEGARTNYN